VHIHRLHIEDIRCFAGVHTVDLPGPGTWTVFAGRNGSGKTTLLRSIAATAVGPTLARTLMGSRLRWVREGKALSTALLQLDPQAGVDLVDGAPEGGPAPLVGPALWWGSAPAGTHDVLGSVSDQRGDLSPGDVRLGVGELQGANPAVMSALRRVDAGPWRPNPSGWFLAAYGAHRHLGPPTKDIQDRSVDPVYARVVSLFSEAATLSDAVEWLKTVHLRALEGKAGAAELKDGALRFLAQGLLPDHSEVVRVDSDGLWVRRDGVLLPLEDLSDGYRTVTALVLDLLRHLHRCFGALDLEQDASGRWVCPKPGVVLIDEVDAHLHVEWQQRIGFWLTQHFPRLQFLVTTHSPFICQAASPGGLIRLPGPGEDRRMEVVPPELHRTVTMGGADAAVLSELFGLDSPRSRPAEALRDAVAELEVRLLGGGATEADRATYVAMKAQLPDDLAELSEQSLRTLGLRRGRR
jgi:hypothetical protein